ncbi:uncharacterized protein (TIGR02599 family) [Prosthecobacter fusiformis]|uniref:Uncharacterized protein (TIGR02599 family) n=1 Tax=Prosthecobacter fusiformis TaxID=48464 RepID=A0A4R7RSA5_9BACT|nr:Verru_Chthon cassette protein C [Prosthecobacter fusiformis]TDU67197.1 uncharacterized protein (TIGR02599 family) [Prosthecobacter fusiformis]
MKNRFPTRSARPGFSLVELLVSMAVISILMLIFATMTDRTASIWRSTRGKVSQFQQARDAFETITRNLSQATLNTYLDYYDKSGARRDQTNAASFEPGRYGRYSELRFRSGAAAAILQQPPAQTPGHALFFYAPLGETGIPTHGALHHLLNLTGYYITYGEDTERPSFLPLIPTYGFRLMELKQRSESLVPLGGPERWPPDVAANPDAHIIARNIIAITFLPKLPGQGPAGDPSVDPTGSALAPNYEFDSFTEGQGGLRKELSSQHQLPPIVEVTMVAIDDASAERIGGSSEPPDLGLADLFQNADAEIRKADLETLLKNLRAKQLNARVFTTQVSLKSAKWSRE